MKTNQEIFDIVAKHLLTQGVRSQTAKKFENSDGYYPVCAYRGEGGRKCAAGVLIPDSKYNALMEGLNVGSAHVSAALDGVSSASLDLLTALQRMHDVEEPLTWPDELKNIAAGYALTYNEAAYGPSLSPDYSLSYCRLP